VGGGHRDRTRERQCLPMKPIELAERLVAALETKDRQAWDRLLARTVVVRDLQPPPDWPPLMRGREAPWEHLGLAGDVFEDFHRENDEYVEMGDWVIVVGRWTGTAKGSGVPIDQRTVNALRIRNDQVVEWVWSLPDKQAAVDYVQRPTNEFSRSQTNPTPEPR
jgi:ketosteroid isomerase-like protein